MKKLQNILNNKKYQNNRLASYSYSIKSSFLQNIFITLIFFSGMMVTTLSYSQPYVPAHDPILQQVAKEVPPKEILQEENQKIGDNMVKIARNETRGMAGLAAPQIGVPLQIILVNMNASLEKADNSMSAKIYINPKIIWKSEEEVEEYFEGCFSTGSLIGMVPRYKTVRIEAYTRNGNKEEFEFTGYTARIFQHEIDHLHGLRFPDRMKENFDKLHWVEAGKMAEYATNFNNWDKKCSKDEWLSFINEAPPSNNK